MMGINLRMPHNPLRPVITDEGEMYAPRYITYKERQVRFKLLNVLKRA